MLKVFSSLTIFLYMFLVLLLFALVKKKGYFKCSKHPNKTQDVTAIANEVIHLKSMMADKSGVEFKLTYSRCHEDKDSHSLLASMINFILVHRKNKELKDPTFRRMNEVECLFHSTPQVPGSISVILSHKPIAGILQMHQEQVHRQSRHQEVCPMSGGHGPD